MDDKPFIMTLSDSELKYSLILDKPDINKIKIDEQIMTNEDQSKYKINVNLTGEMIIAQNNNNNNNNNNNKPLRFENKHISKRMKKESYNEYLNRLNTIDAKNYKWIYNIIDKKAEVKSIIYEDDKFILIPNYIWNKRDIKYLNILAIVKNKNLIALRSLTQNDIALLKHIKQKSEEIIAQVYNVEPDRLKSYIHYPPSTWHLHIHFNTLENLNVSSSVEYSHELTQIIYNLGLSSDYYKKFDLFVPIL